MINNLFKEDNAARIEALNPLQSFIVQAPAGSGKTELLVLRYLTLLSRANFPESIIAITFTRKAANEMKHRILEALSKASSILQPMALNETKRWELAKKVLIQDHKMKWNLLANPKRLRIQTIDSFCQRLTRQMPLFSKLDQQLTPIDNPQFLYHLAARQLIHSLEIDSPWQKALITLLTHTDNNFSYLEELLSQSLATREQWLSYLLHDPTCLRENFEKNLYDINQTLIKRLDLLIKDNFKQQLTEVITFSRQQLQKNFLTYNSLEFWQAVSCFALTEKGEWRKSLTIKEGFPAPSLKNCTKQQKAYYAAMKKNALDLLTQFKEKNDLYEAFIAFREAPPLRYTDQQWEIILALFTLMPLLVAYLKLVFKQSKKVDYTEILLCALIALGNDDTPSDLALSLDYQIEHLLIDEFQDTSLTQFKVIEKITAAWQANDERTLFLVGDPMQSIYRFRKAEVSLFLKAKHQGIGQIHLKSLTLSINFRSNSSIVHWINKHFSELLPKKNTANLSKIVFTPAVAFAKEYNNEAVNTYWFSSDNQEIEIQKIICVIEKIVKKNPNDSIAILVRSRTHLKKLLPALQKNSLAYQAIEIENLAENSAVQDMVALTRALSHLGDKISWLALLRSPFCGLNLNDLYQITHYDLEKMPFNTIWYQLSEFEKIELPEESKQRCRRIVPIIQQSLAEQSSLALPIWIKKAWLRLGGPTTLTQPDDITYIHRYLDYLEKKINLEGQQLDFFKLEKELTNIVIENKKTHVNPITIMTIHKAKGLEFDHVVLPFLDRTVNSDRSKLILFKENHRHKTIDFLAAIPAKQEHPDLLYSYLSLEEKKKNYEELIRLLYVATTRAKKTLSFLGRIDNKDKNPSLANSLLYILWKAKITFETCYFLANTNQTIQAEIPKKTLLRRLASDWQHPFFIPTLHNKSIKPIHYQWQPNVAKATGIVIHRLLYQISQDGLKHWDNLNLDDQDLRFLRLLEQSGVVSVLCSEALNKVKRALKKIMADPRGRWILASNHQEAQSEFSLSVIQAKQVKQFIIDRTFIEANTRWIIDYKTSIYPNDDLEYFLEKRTHYKKQLETYATIFAALSPLKNNNRICLGLYFPLNTTWYEWEYLAPINLHNVTV